MNTLFDLKGKNVIVTGAGSGIGQETSRTISKLGAFVIMLDISKDGLIETANEMSKDSYVYKVVDLSNIDSLSSIISEFVSNYGLIDGLVHCAGISSRKPLNMLKPEGFDKIMRVNVYSFVELVKQIVRKGNYAENASIVAISSVSSIKGYKAKTEYCMSKAALDAVIRCLAVELIEKRIRINSIMPGIVDTPMAIKTRNLNAAINAGSDDSSQPLGNCQPIEIANMIAYLLSEKACSITGTSIKIDGGLTI